MPQTAWSSKRERQYDHIKESLKERGLSRDCGDLFCAAWKVPFLVYCELRITFCTPDLVPSLYVI